MSGSGEQTGPNLNGLHLWLFRGAAPQWPSNGAPRATETGSHFEAEVVILPGGHAVRLTSEGRTLVEYICPDQPGPDPVVDLQLQESARGGLFTNDRLLYRASHDRTDHADEAAYTAALADAEQALRAGGAAIVPNPKGGPGSPLVAVLARDHEVEVRALYRDAANRTLLRWVSVVGLKLKLRR
ncbi:MAG: hypothetical protein ACYTGX_09550 [Planctomycetota bacterium]|jgi:hypothetical protein